MTFNIESGAEAIIKFIRNDGESDLRWESNILSSTPQDRMVVQYLFYRGEAVSDSQPFLNLTGKFYADERGGPVYQTMQSLRSSLSQTSAPHLLAIPNPLFYDSDSRLVVQQYVSGIPYKKIIAHHDYQKYFRLAGKALALLHTQDISIGEKKSIHDHLRDLIHPHPMRFCEELPQYRHLVEELIKEMRERELRVEGEIEILPLHRDFHLGQLFYGEGRVWLIDWDLFAKGDPALDVGNFLVYLETHLEKKCVESKEAFLEGYTSLDYSAIMERVPIYEALTYLRLACKRFRLKEKDWRNKVKEMLSRSERCFLKENHLCY